MPVLNSLRGKKIKHITNVESNSQASIKWSGGQGKLSKGLSVGYALKNLKYVQVTEIKFCTAETK